MRIALAAIALSLFLHPATAEDRIEAELKASAKALVEQLASKEPGVREEALKAAATNQHALLTTPLIKLSKDKDFATRIAALNALGTREHASERKKAAKAVAARLGRLSAKPETRTELMQAIDALHNLAHPISIKPLLDNLSKETDRGIATARLMAVSNVCSAEAVEGLINFAAKGRRMNRLKDVTRKALKGATGANVAGGADEWRAWWKKNKRDFDFEAVRVAREEAAAKRKAKEDKKRERKEKRDRKKRGEG